MVCIVSIAARHSSQSGISSPEQRTGHVLCKIRKSEGATSGPAASLGSAHLYHFADGKTGGMCDPSFGLISDFTGLQGKYLMLVYS